MCLPLLVLRPDLDSSQDSRKVSLGIFQKKIDEVIEGEKISALWIVTTVPANFRKFYSKVGRAVRYEVKK
jgi:hypothetical protein